MSSNFSSTSHPRLSMLTCNCFRFIYFAITPEVSGRKEVHK